MNRINYLFFSKKNAEKLIGFALTKILIDEKIVISKNEMAKGFLILKSSVLKKSRKI